ncbi:MAG: Sua5/YciO/YrdC/YwlC family protein [Gammaproteobacteria bacterium]|nr:Sua5/YciO/YrdC/YwlC family protein [Gammaproteobacteria bacterium]
MSVEKACAAVRRGGLIAYPTEGVFGFGCDPACLPAVERIIALKGRDAAKGLIIIASAQSQLDNYMETLAPETQSRIDATWPGPVTWIVPARTGVNPLLTGQRPTLAVRVSAHPVVREICDSLGHGLISTSANRSGDAPLRTAAQVRQMFSSDVDVIVEGATGERDKPTPIFDAQTLKQLR